MHEISVQKAPKQYLHSGHMPNLHASMSIDKKALNRSRNPMDYTFHDTELLSRFVTETGKILPRKDTGLSAKHQRRITNRIKQARNMLTMQ